MIGLQSLAWLPIIAPLSLVIGFAWASCLHTKEGPLGIIAVFGILGILLGCAIDLVVYPVLLLIALKGKPKMRAIQLKHFGALCILVCVVFATIGIVRAVPASGCTIAP